MKEIYSHIYNFIYTNIILILGCIIIIIMFFYRGMFTINYTDSIPKGLYYIKKSKPIKGNYTLVYSHDILNYAVKRGYIMKYVYIGKLIVATKDDTVCENNIGVYVNGIYIHKSKPLVFDSKGREMPKYRGCIVLTGKQVFVMGDREKSFDSRYFGPVTQYKDTLIPIITF